MTHKQINEAVARFMEPRPVHGDAYRISKGGWWEMTGPRGWGPTTDWFSPPGLDHDFFAVLAKLRRKGMLVLIADNDDATVRCRLLDKHGNEPGNAENERTWPAALATAVAELTERS